AEVLKQREIDERPALIVNKLPAFTDQVINDSRLNEISIKIKPYGGGATKEIAETLNGLIRNIENTSNADVAYQTALEGAVNNGFGYFRIITSFVDETSFDQELRFKRVRNPMTVYFDPAHVEHDGRDARFVFVTEVVSRKEYKVRYPNKDLSPFDASNTSNDTMGLWSGEDWVRIAEYWVKEPVKKKIYLLSDGRTVDGDKWDSIVDDLKANEKMVHFIPNPDPNAPPEQVEGPAPEGSGFQQQVLNPTPEKVRDREMDSHKVVQYLIDGAGIIDGPTKWLGKFIPIIPVWGKELVIDDERILRGLIRFAKDSQRMYDYFRTAATETVALAPKAPYVVEERQVEGNEDDWASVNKKNLPYLKYKAVRGVQAPLRQIVTQTALGEITEANIANDEMKSTTSLHDPSLGEQGNETSGRAILARQRRSDIANFVFHDNQKRAIKYAGDILIDLIPKIYDTTRQLAIIKADGEEEFVTVNQLEVDAATGNTVIVNDLTLGRYKVVATSGPSFSTQREESTASMLDFIRVSPNAAQFMMDLVAENMDWPGAVKIANRLKKLLRPGIDEDGPLPEQGPDLD
ncbi:hypothetical protein KAR91_23355, partial [Candidatus Pacearchaeota archaeon]|nr:hypothetical protein [Candidatus Pacearchaeota archaeon]